MRVVLVMNPAGDFVSRVSNIFNVMLNTVLLLV